MVITLTDCSSQKGTADNVKLYFPVVPEKIKYSSAANFQEYRIINKGTVKFPSGTEVSGIGWECFFPGKKIQSLPFVNHKDKTALALHKQLETWRDNGTLLKLNITGTPFAFDVYIDTYDAVIQDAYESIYYTIEFAKAITISVGTTTAKKVIQQRSSKTSTQRTYTVVSGDNLWKIARKFYGGTGILWSKIYNANKDKIESEARRRGRKSSDNGHWIYPGTVLAIP